MVADDENFICGFGGIAACNTDADVDGSHIRTLWRRQRAVMTFTRLAARSPGERASTLCILARMHRLLWIAALAACGGQPAPPDASFPHDSSPSTFTLSSPVLRDGARFADMNTCASGDTSPQLDWAGAPAGTQSFAVVLVNRSYFDQLHWVIYDVAATATGLPAGVEKAYAPANVAGAHQTTSYAEGKFGYLGPCTQFQDTYQITVYAIDSAALPGMTHDTSPADASYIIDAHKLGYAGLLGTSSP